MSWRKFIRRWRVVLLSLCVTPIVALGILESVTRDWFIWLVSGPLVGEWGVDLLLAHGRFGIAVYGNRARGSTDIGWFRDDVLGLNNWVAGSFSGPNGIEIWVPFWMVGVVILALAGFVWRYGWRVPLPGHCYECH